MVEVVVDMAVQESLVHGTEVKIQILQCLSKRADVPPLSQVPLFDFYFLSCALVIPVVILYLSRGVIFLVTRRKVDFARVCFTEVEEVCSNVLLGRCCWRNSNQLGVTSYSLFVMLLILLGKGLRNMYREREKAAFLSFFLFLFRMQPQFVGKIMEAACFAVFVLDLPL